MQAFAEADLGNLEQCITSNLGTTLASLNCAEHVAFLPLICVLCLCTCVWCAALILVPTRELALQTSQVCKELGKHMGVEIMVTTGGTSLRDDIVRLGSPVHMVVATPGRILDLSSKGVANLSNCRVLVMDEVSQVDCISLRSWP